MKTREMPDTFENLHHTEEFLLPDGCSCTFLLLGLLLISILLVRMLGMG